MSKPKIKRLWKTTIVIWTKTDPRDLEILDLARNATDGAAFCSKQDSVEVIGDPTKDPDWQPNPLLGPDSMLGFNDAT